MEKKTPEMESFNFIPGITEYDLLNKATPSKDPFVDLTPKGKEEIKTPKEGNNLRSSVRKMKENNK